MAKIFVLLVTLPYTNTAAGQWALGWHSTENGRGDGEGAGKTIFLAIEAEALA